MSWPRPCVDSKDSKEDVVLYRNVSHLLQYVRQIQKLKICAALPFFLLYIALPGCARLL